MQDLKITAIQSDLHWEDIGANLAMFEEKIWQIGEPTDVIVLPEMFTTGFSMDAPRLAEQMNMRTFKWITIACFGWSPGQTSKPTINDTFSEWLKSIRYTLQVRVC